jgi:hypothetical protein
VTNLHPQKLSALLTEGLATELSYLSADAQAECLDRYEFLLSCEEDELPDAADFVALAL